MELINPPIRNISGQDVLTPFFSLEKLPKKKKKNPVSHVTNQTKGKLYLHLGGLSEIYS